MDKPLIPVVAAVISDPQNKLLITKRAPQQHLAGLWEFPGGAIENDEKPDQALRREIREELAVDIAVGRLLWQQTFEYDVKRVDIRFFECSMIDPNQQILCREVAEYRWVDCAELGNYTFPPADEAFLQKLIQRTPMAQDPLPKRYPDSS